MSKNTVIKDIGAIICGVICLVWGIYSFYAVVVWWNYYYLPQTVLCFVSICLTVWRFFRKGKGLPYKEYEWIPLIISIVYFLVLTIASLSIMRQMAKAYMIS